MLLARNKIKMSPVITWSKLRDLLQNG